MTDDLSKRIAKRLGEAWPDLTEDPVYLDQLAAQANVVVAPELERLRAHVLDIAAHATPYGDIPDDPGYVGTYLLTAGALHRALGTIGHTAPSCQAEAERDEQARDRHRWRTRAEQAEAERDALKAELERLTGDCWTMHGQKWDLRKQLAQAEATIERARAYLDGIERHCSDERLTVPPWVAKIRTALDTPTPTEETDRG
jgi:hypothetical protein